MPALATAMSRRPSSATQSSRADWTWGLEATLHWNDGGAAAKLAHRRGRFVGAADVDVGDADVGAVTGEPLGGASADAGASTGNKRDPIVVRTHTLPLVPFLDYCACALVGGC